MIWISSAIFALFLIAALVKKYDAKLRYVEWTSKLANEISMDDDDYIKHRGHQLTFTFPGTKWCGPGNIASNYNDLGVERETDICCRAHDNCENIPAGETKNNLTNNGMFTRLHCDCDHEFYDCLKSTKTMVSNEMGFLYFNTIHSYCYMEEYPVKRCRVRRQWFLQRRCVEYDLDTNKPKEWQWFDLPIWK